jgi:hypothetical protein
MENEVFWREWAEIGRDMLSYGKEIQFGNSLVEVKFMHGTPTVIIRSKSVKKKYPDNAKALDSINKIMENSSVAQYDGAQTFTIAWHQGSVSQVILDEYSNTLIK